MPNLTRSIGAVDELQLFGPRCRRPVGRRGSRCPHDTDAHLVRNRVLAAGSRRPRRRRRHRVRRSGGGPGCSGHRRVSPTIDGHTRRGSRRWSSHPGRTRRRRPEQRTVGLVPAHLRQRRHPTAGFRALRRNHHRSAVRHRPERERGLAVRQHGAGTQTATPRLPTNSRAGRTSTPATTPGLQRG